MQIPRFCVPTYPYEKWRYDSDSKVWHTIVKTKKQFKNIVNVIRTHLPEGVEFQDNRGQWEDCYSRVKMDLWVDQDNANVEFLTMSGDTYFVREEIKTANGQWEPNEKVWENIDAHAGGTVLRQLIWYGFDVFGTFNQDGRYNSLLQDMGMVLAEPRSLPPGFSLEEDAKYYRMFMD